MFEKELENKFKKIFSAKKVSYDQPSDSKEQEAIFIEITESKNVIKDGRAKAMVTGNALMFGNAEKIPFGYFSKCIKQADPADTAKLYFYDFESNTKFYRNIVQRGFSFIYFFDSQYDPEVGIIDELTLSVEET